MRLRVVQRNSTGYYDNWTLAMLFEDVYMAQCQGFVDDTHPNFVCKLHKSLYGLKQAPHAWFECFTNQLLTLGFIASNAVPSMFIFHQQSCTLFLLVFVDDIIIIGINLSAISDMITQLYSTFEVKDLGTLTYILGLQIDYSSTGLFFHQYKYTTDLLHKFKMWHCKSYSTPCYLNSRLD